MSVRPFLFKKKEGTGIGRRFIAGYSLWQYVEKSNVTSNVTSAASYPIL